MKKTILVLICISMAAALVLGSCAKKQQDGAFDRIASAGKIVLGTSADYPPYEFQAVIDGKNTIVGFDIAIAEAIAKDLGVTLEIKDMDFDGLLAALVSGNIDFVIAGMTPTAERSKNVDFSNIYYYAEHGVLIRAADAGKYNADVSTLADKMVGAQRGAIQAGLAKTRIKGVAEDQTDEPHAQVKELGKLPDLIMELKNSKVEAVVVEKPVAKAYLGANPDLMLASYSFSDDDGGSAIAVKKGEATLLAAINNSIARLLADGSIDRFVAEATELVEY